MAQRELEKRFSVRLLEGYGTTEIPLILACRRDAETIGTVGTPADGMQVALVDDDDALVPVGESGLRCVRPEVPFSVALGYWNKPEATAVTFTNLWFHTGDLLREREDGSGFEYVGRSKDSIRRRGENISAWEVEQAGLKHTDVLECAAIGVPSEVGDEDVALLIVLREGAVVAPSDLLDFMVERLPRFAAPRYIEVVDSLPKTPSERIDKYQVRERGLTAAAVDLHPPR
jgi:crotonobetaine/carnitine-CoA ligase